PTVGSSAAEPGYGVLAEKSTAARPMHTRPPQPEATCRAAGSRRSTGTASASAAPSASSQTRVNVEKYAVSGEAAVASIDHTSDASPTAPTTATLHRTRSPTASKVSESTSGQTR